MRGGGPCDWLNTNEGRGPCDWLNTNEGEEGVQLCGAVQFIFHACDV